MKKLKVGFLIDDMDVNSYVADLIDHVNDSDFFDSPVLITGFKRASKNRPQKLKKLLRNNPIKILDRLLLALLSRLIRKVEYRLAVGAFPSYGKTVNLQEEKECELVLVEGLWSKSKLFLDFTAADLQKINETDFDCIIRCGSGILRGEILNLPRYGVLSFHHGDNRKNRGGPSGFWEVFNNEPSSGFIIQKLNNELDGGEVLVRGNIMTMGTWLQNNAQLLQKSNVFFKKLLDYIAKNNSLPLREGPRLHDKKLFRIGSSLTLVCYLIKILGPKILRRISAKILGPNVMRWSIAYSTHNNFSKSLWRYKEIENPKGRYLADPFIFEKDGSTYIFVEDFFYSDNKGRISAIRIAEEEYDFLGVVLEEDFHLSFPYIFESDGEIFMVPETHEAKDVRLYKCVDFPMKWALEKVLMKDVSAADTMLIYRDEKWFMLTNICSAGCGDFQSELHIFYADSLVTSEWHSIEQGNPVIFDSLAARNGGFFKEGDAIYRINQIQGKEHYGKSFGVNKVIELSTRSYIEERLNIVDSDFKRGIISTHHFNANEKFAVLDCCSLQRLRKAIET